jgi:hypothetical protein
VVPYLPVSHPMAPIIYPRIPCNDVLIFSSAF